MNKADSKVTSCIIPFISHFGKGKTIGRKDGSVLPRVGDGGVKGRRTADYKRTVRSCFRVMEPFQTLVVVVVP